MNKKICNTCNIEKNLNEFYYSPGGRLKTTARCRKCRNSKHVKKEPAIVLIENLDGEKWKPVQGHESRYEISNMGRMKSLSREVPCHGGGFKYSQTRLLSICNMQGYRVVGLYHGELKKLVRVHRLVAAAFIPNPENKAEVNHIDGNKANNCVQNLEWSTCKENINHAFRTGLKINAKGEESSVAKLSNDQVARIKTMVAEKVKFKQKDIAKKYNVSPATIWGIVNNKTWQDIQINDNNVPAINQIECSGHDVCPEVQMGQVFEQTETHS